MFDGSTQDFQEFAAALAGKSKVKLLSFQKCTIMDGKSILDNVSPVLSVMVTTSKLQLDWPEYWIPASLHPREDSAEVRLPLAQLLGKVVRCDIWNSSKLAALSSAMKYHNTGPAELYVCGSMKEEDAHHVADIMSHNRRRLKKVTISELSESPIDPLAAPLATALANNTFLKQLIFKWAEGNREDISKTLCTFADVLETKNWTLNNLKFEGSLHTMVPEQLASLQRIKRYTKLNWLDRSKVLKKDPNNTPRDAWVAKLRRSRNDIDCIFYFLSMNPFLCDGLPGRAPADNRTVAMRTRKKRKVGATVTQ